MTGFSGDERDRERHAKRRERRRKERHDEDGSQGDIQRPAGIEELRRARNDFYADRAKTDNKVVKMPSASPSRASLSSTNSPARHKHKSRSKRSSGIDGRKSRSKGAREKISTETYVYEVDGERVTETKTTYLEKGKASVDAGPEDEGTMSHIQEEDSPTDEKVRVVYVMREKARSSRHGSDRREERDRPTSDRSKEVIEPVRIIRPSSRKVHSVERRSHSHAPRSRPQSYAESAASAPLRRSSALNGLFNLQTSNPPVKLIECTICLADDIPSTKSARLKCGHRMCHSCLKRNFKLSITDPQHMPPRCCTSDHIPLHHVDNLFDTAFKRNWNRKFQEYTTKNRIYCPSRRCGEFILPENIHRDKDAKKYGICGNCKTKVCYACNAKWHGGKDCPKDDETSRLLETAKQAGWQRCYNCRTMVELKEGCNHMTCRCRAEFCMVCGLKWKTCQCPWFNYETVENDRLLHMRIPGDPFLVPNPHVRNPRSHTDDDELGARRRQERADEALARRLQDLALRDYGPRADGYHGGTGDIMGIGNGAGHFLNESFRRPGGTGYMMRDPRPPPALGRYMPPPRLMPMLPIRARDMIDRFPPPGPPPPAIRRQVIEEIVNIIPTFKRVPVTAIERDQGSKASEAPAPKTPERSRSLASRARTPADNTPGSSELAGLNTKGSGGGSGRVKAWRSHVRPGVEPEEGMFSMVQ